MVLEKDLFDYFATKSLLTDGGSNSKIAKNTLQTYYLALNPYKTNSLNINLCSHASKECIKACLVNSGMNIMASAVRARKYRTELFIHYKSYFLTKLWLELFNIDKQSEGHTTLIRLNTYSDIDWEEEFDLLNCNELNPNFSLSNFKNLQFYNYTKVPVYILNNKLQNVHFTFSYSGYNWNFCEKFLNENLSNVAVVFYPSVPSEYKGYKVINGDITDERIYEGTGKIIGLRYKLARGVIFNPKESPFVICQI